MRETLRMITAVLATLTMTAVCSSEAAASDLDEVAGVLHPVYLPVVTVATRTETPEYQIASSVTVITAEEIAQKQARTLADVLRDVPGLNLVQSGGPGAQASVFMRGTNSNHTKVLIDGIDVSDPSSTGANFDFSQLLARDIARVEVLRGPQSGLYGSDAIGGVINIVTKGGYGAPEVSGSAEGGSFDTFNQAGALRGASGQLHYSANVEHLHTGSTPVTPLDLLSPGERRIDDYYDNLTASTKLGYDVTKNLDVGLTGRYTQGHLRVTGDDFSSFPSHPAAQQSEADTIEYYARGTLHAVVFEGALDQVLGIAYTRKRTANLSPDSPESLDTGSRAKVDWQGTIEVAKAEKLVLGVEHERDEISDPLSASATDNAGYVELQSQIGAGFFAAINARYDDNDRFGSKVTYRVAPAFVVAQTGTKLKASFGTGFKAPTLAELFQSFPAFFFFANPNLRPETSVGYDAGVEQSFADLHGSLGVTYFHNQVRDLITSDVTGTTYANIGRAVTQGIESFISYKAGNTLTLRLDYTYTEATDTELNEELLRRPKHKGSVGVLWQPMEAFTLDATVLTVGSWIDGNRDFSIPRLQASGYTVVNVAGSYDFSPRVALFGRVDNLLDRQYQNPVGFLHPRIGVFAGIRLRN
jgi:vitamin B12 transporter